MLLGASLPLVDIGGDPIVVRDYAQAAEALGFAYLVAPDHVTGVNPATEGQALHAGTSGQLYHDPFVLFGFLAGCTTRIGFATGVLILPQRQTVLVAKQVACLDVLCGGRFRLGLGVGWSKSEFIALNEDFHTRGRRSEEQVPLMQALWAEPHVSFAGRWHKVEDAGINPRPASGRVPVWYGGHEDVTLRRVAKWGDGWMPLDYPPDETALAAFERLWGYVREAGRDPKEVGLEVWVSPGGSDPDMWRKEIAFWKQAGVTHATVHTTYPRGHHRRIEGRTADAHLAAIARYREAVADLA